MFDKLVDRTYLHWLLPHCQQDVIDQCAKNALLAVRVYVKLQNARGLPGGRTRKDFVRRLDEATFSLTRT